MLSIYIVIFLFNPINNLKARYHYPIIMCNLNVLSSFSLQAAEKYSVSPMTTQIYNSAPL